MNSQISSVGKSPQEPNHEMVTCTSENEALLVRPMILYSNSEVLVDWYQLYSSYTSWENHCR
jgi:hypothetical protein